MSVTSAAYSPCCRYSQRGDTVLGEIDRIAQSLQLHLQQLAVDRMILGHQHAAPAGRRRQRAGATACRGDTDVPAAVRNRRDRGCAGPAVRPGRRRRPPRAAASAAASCRRRQFRSRHRRGARSGRSRISCPAASVVICGAARRRIGSSRGASVTANSSRPASVSSPLPRSAGSGAPSSAMSTSPRRCSDSSVVLSGADRATTSSRPPRSMVGTNTTWRQPRSQSRRDSGRRCCCSSASAGADRLAGSSGSVGSVGSASQPPRRWPLTLTKSRLRLSD